MTKIKVGIIGLGRIASLYEKDIKAKTYYPCLTHVGSYMQNPKIEIVCACDIDKKKLQTFKKMWNIDRLYNDYQRMLKENQIDILSICTTPDKHYEIIKSAHKYVKVIFCEKPFTKNIKEIKKIIQLIRNTNTKIEINLYRQYDDTHNQIKDIILKRTNGNLQRVNCYYGKGLRNMGTHLIGYIMHILGTPEKLKVLNKIKYDNISEYTYDVYFKFKGNIPVIIQSCDFNKYRLFEIDFIFEQSRIQIIDEGLKVKYYKRIKNRAETNAYELIEAKQANTTAGYSLCNAVKHLINLVTKKNTKSIMNPEKYLKLQQVIEQIEKKGAKL